jgi:hypothetical protein
MRRFLSVFLAGVGLISCAVATADTISSTDARSVSADPRELYVYPAKGQSDEQLDRDRYECHMWAVRQTGFDPSVAQTGPAAERPRVRASRPSDTSDNVMRGAVAGAIIGSVVSSPRERGEGALVGATAGAVIGAAASQADASTAEMRKRRIAVPPADPRASGYTRALSACLEGRGYTGR